jgi:hypothetical protein
MLSKGDANFSHSYFFIINLLAIFLITLLPHKLVPSIFVIFLLALMALENIFTLFI